jgi:Ca2+-binding EF-hand superfamily protein
MEENMYRAFQHFDTDNSGTISQAELREALRVSHSSLTAPKVHLL